MSIRNLPLWYTQSECSIGHGISNQLLFFAANDEHTEQAKPLSHFHLVGMAPLAALAEVQVVTSGPVELRFHLM